MNILSLYNISFDAFKIILKSAYPPDKILSEIFKSKKYLGSKDRRFVSELIFSSIRNIIFLKDLASVASDNETKIEQKILVLNSLCALEFNIIKAFDIKGILPKMNIEINDFKIIISQIISNENLFNSYFVANINELIYKHYLSLVSASADNIIAFSKLYSIPEWILQKINSTNINPITFGANSLIPAPAFLRVNLSNADVNSVAGYLSSIKINNIASNLTPASIKIPERVKLDDNDLFRSGAFEIQDEGSQLISYALAPKPNSRILDACAGAGGKTLHIADLTSDKATIVATDTEFGRLKEISKRAKRSNFRSISVKHIKEQDVNSLKKLFDYKDFDYILVDAPCSGLGTIRRDPSRKLRVNENLIAKLSSKQSRILEQYSQFVKIGGYLLYATCSILNEENKDVVEKFLFENPNFEPSPLINSFNQYNIIIDGLGQYDYHLSVSFDKYDFDGFFMALMKRIY